MFGVECCRILPEKELASPSVMCSWSENRLTPKNWMRDRDFSRWQLVPAFCSFALDLSVYIGQAAPPWAAYDLILRHTMVYQSSPEALTGQSP